MTTAPAQAVKIILIEDNPEYRRAISMTMERSEGYELVGKFGSAEQALAELQKPDEVRRAIDEGASGYLLKSSSMQEIREAISLVMQGGATLDPSVAKYLLDQIQSRGPSGLSDCNLSARELEVLELISRGLLRKEIARALSISENTVVTHIRHLYDKLNVSNAPAAIRKAYESGILPVEENPPETDSV